VADYSLGSNDRFCHLLGAHIRGDLQSGYFISVEIKLPSGRSRNRSMNPGGRKRFSVLS
jgi:hypothetical protein